MLDAAAEAGLDVSAEGFASAALPAEPGMATLLLAEVRFHDTAAQGRTIAASARAGLCKLAATAQARQQVAHAAKAAGAEKIKEAETKVSLSHQHMVCVPITSSMSCDQPILVDHATDVSVSSDTVLVEVDRGG